MPMTEAADLLRLLQHADSVFPSGAVAFSGGLEGLVGDGLLAAPERLESVLVDLVEGRFLCADRLLLGAAWQAASESGALMRLDTLADAALPARELREGSRRAGGALLSVHRRLGTPGTAEYAALIAGGEAIGHLPIVQGLAWRGVGLDLSQSQAAAGHALLAAALSAALRLGMVGHVGAQRLHTLLRERLATGLAMPLPPVESLASAAPLLDIAALRHERQSVRLFAS